MTILQLITKPQNIAEARSNDLKVFNLDGEPPDPIIRIAEWDSQNINKDEEYVEL